MPWADLSEGLSGLRRWSKPVIYDRLIAASRKLISDHELARNLTRLHARVWHALIRGDMAEFEEMRETLVGALEPCDLTLDHLGRGRRRYHDRARRSDGALQPFPPHRESLPSRPNGLGRPIAADAARRVTLAEAPRSNPARELICAPRILSTAGVFHDKRQQITRRYGHNVSPIAATMAS
jgi:hypothetical protein